MVFPPSWRKPKAKRLGLLQYMKWKKTQGLWTSSACCLVKKKARDIKPLACEPFNPQENLRLPSLESSCSIEKITKGRTFQLATTLEAKTNLGLANLRCLLRKKMRVKHPQVLNLSTKRKTQGLEAPYFLTPLRRKLRAFGSWSFQPK